MPHIQPETELPKTPKIKIYTAKLSQSGTNAPVATILHNTLGGTPIWTRTASGTYRATLDDAFPQSKTYVNVGFNGDVYSNFAQGLNETQDYITLFTGTWAGGTADSIMTNQYPAYIEIRIYQ